MNNLEIVVTEDGRIELVVDGDGSFLLENKDDSEYRRLIELLHLAKGVVDYAGTCRLSVGEVDETA